VEACCIEPLCISPSEREVLKSRLISYHTTVLEKLMKDLTNKLLVVRETEQGQVRQVADTLHKSLKINESTDKAGKSKRMSFHQNVNLNLIGPADMFVESEYKTKLYNSRFCDMKI